MTDIVTAAVRKTLAEPSITSLLGDTNGTPWVFQWKPYLEVSGSSRCGIVVSANGNWATPNRHNSLRLPRIEFRVIADPPRDLTGDEAGQVLTQTAEQRALEIEEALFDVFHITTGESQDWGGVRVISSVSLGQVDTQDMPNADHTFELIHAFAVTHG